MSCHYYLKEILVEFALEYIHALNKETSKRMEDNVIQPPEYDIYINSIKMFQVNDIGSSEWFDSHEILIKFNQQAIIEAASHREELVKELFVLNDKLAILVHEAYCVLVWRTRVLPKMVMNECDANSTFLLYSVLYHEGASISLLEILLYHENGCQALGDSAVDLIDYCTQAIVQLIGLTHLKHVQENVDPKKLSTENASDELERQTKDLLYKIGLRCLTILSFIADKIDTMPINVVRRMVCTHDVPCLMSEVLHCQPWIRNVKGVEKYVDDKWISINKIDMIKVTKVEAQVWFCLRQLLLSKEAMSFYEMNLFRQREISKCHALLSVNLLDQLPPLVDLKHRLCSLSMGGCDTRSSGIILEEIPEIKENIIENAKEIGFKQIAKNHMERFFHLRGSDLVNIAQRLNDIYNVERFENENDETIKNKNDEVQQHCAQCFAVAIKKCSKCEQSFYCSRECQVRNWPVHKEICRSK